MIGRAASAGMAPRDDAVDQYIAALLDVTPQPESADGVVVTDGAQGKELATLACSEEPKQRVADAANAYYLCNVSGLQLAVAKSAVDWVGPVPEPLASSQLSLPWLLGNSDHDGRVCHVVDLARIIVPGDAQSVRWRDNPASRPWLAGMASEPLCAVLNVRGLTESLSRELQRDAR
ncbi:MAG: hypothetical protein CVV05_20280 [Gammaproteobacteria bacterium HGW-Gammaproteobacteria-1]|nr:MAG: hypothetical protein CVV05_20280 [Gammaproteobacteria bacterium HGW-Gammaproteobacteria-1]